MYVYLIKSSIYFKIGFSKNPDSRLNTIKTHNPFEVILFAKLKTDNYLELEKELHSLFANKNSRREWFELNEDDLLILKIDYGFTFLHKINSIKNNDVSNANILNEVKQVRIDNSKIDYFISYFEELYGCKIYDLKPIKKCCNKFDVNIIKESIDSLFTQDKTESEAYAMLFKVCESIKESKESPEKYFTKIIKAIYYKQYNTVLHESDLKFLEDEYNRFLNINEVIKNLNSKKFYLDQDEFWLFIKNNYIAAL